MANLASADGRLVEQSVHVYRKQRSLTKTAPSPHRERCNGTALVHRRPVTPLDAGFPSPFPLFSPHHTTLCTCDLPKHPKVNLNSSSSLREDPKNGCRRCRCTVGVHHGPVDTAGSRSLPLLSPFLLLLYNIYIYKLPKHLKVSLNSAESSSEPRKRMGWIVLTALSAVLVPATAVSTGHTFHFMMIWAPRVFCGTPAKTTVLRRLDAPVIFDRPRNEISVPLLVAPRPPH